MGSRTRFRNRLSSPNGSYRYYTTSSPGTAVQNTEAYLYRETMTDTTGPKPWIDHPLLHDKFRAEPITFNGNSATPPYLATWNNFAPLNRASYSYCPVPSAVNWPYYKTKALANMNPSKPSVDLPVFLFELRDFPRMLHQMGRVLDRTVRASDVAGGYVAYSFGWAPFLSDLNKLLNFEKVLSDRLKYLQRIGKDGGDRVKRTLENSTTTLSTTPYTLSGYGNTYPYLYQGQVQVVEKRKVWAVAKVRTVNPVSLERGVLGDAARAALGLNLSAASIWEAIPWSWLLDYFGNVGDYLDATRGFIPARITDMNLMCTQTIESTLTGKTLIPGVSSSGSGKLTTIRKQRTVYALPTASIATTPWFTPHMAGILASLSTSKALRSIGK